MEDNNISNLLNQFNNMIKSNNIPDNLKDIINNFNNSNNSSSDTSVNGNTSNSNDENNNNFDIDINTLLKMKKIMESIKSDKNDSRTSLLLSLKPYLKESRRKKVDQYIKLFNMEKVFETFNSLGGDSKNDV